MAPSLNFLGITISTYFLVISIACILSATWFLKRASKHDLNSRSAIDLTICILICGFLGARLFHVFYEEPSYYFSNPLAVLEIWNGGFVFLGGVIGALIGSIIFCQIRGEPFWMWADIAAIPISFGYALGRVGCFLNGCCYGHYCTLPWSVYLQGGSRHPTQLYATTIEFLVMLFLLKIEPRIKVAGLLFNLWLVMHSVARIFMEQFRDDPRGPMFLSLSISTWLSLGLGLFGLSQMLLAKKSRDCS